MIEFSKIHVAIDGSETSMSSGVCHKSLRDNTSKKDKKKLEDSSSNIVEEQNNETMILNYEMIVKQF
jgi:hypothetical protein